MRAREEKQINNHKDKSNKESLRKMETKMTFILTIGMRVEF